MVAKDHLFSEFKTNLNSEVMDHKRFTLEIKYISTAMANNLTNINKTNNYLSSQIIEHKKDQGYL